MPTAGKLAGGVLFAALAWIVSEMVKPLFPDGFDPGLLSEVNAVLGLILGWRIAGSRAGTGFNAALSYGLTTTVALTLLCLFVGCFSEMVRLSLNRRYDGPMEALSDVIEQMIEYGQILGNGPVLLVLIGGGILAGLLTEYVGRNFR